LSPRCSVLHRLLHSGREGADPTKLALPPHERRRHSDAAGQGRDRRRYRHDAGEQPAPLLRVIPIEHMHLGTVFDDEGNPLSVHVKTFNPQVNPDKHAGLRTAGLVGSSIDCYDFFLYGTAVALVFPQVFFPDTSGVTGTLL